MQGYHTYLQSLFLTILLVLFIINLKANPLLDKASTIQVSVIDSVTEAPTSCRIRITAKNKVVKVLPQEAIGIMYGLWDHADGYQYQPDSSFYVNGNFIITLPLGEYNISISKGLEYRDQHHTIILRDGEIQSIQYKLRRWINMTERGWFSADDHIHIRRSPREDSVLLQWLSAENLNVGVMLRMGDFWATYYDQYAWGKKGVFQNGNHLLASGQEDPRTPELGHAVSIGATDKVRYQNEYYYYDKVFDHVHQLDGLTGYAHQAESFHGYRGLILDGLRGKVDVLELLQFCVSENPLKTAHYYHMLDLGIPITAVAGSDFPWCGKDHNGNLPEQTARIGNVRFYTFTGKDTLKYSDWKDGLKAGHTFVTSGPMIDFKINNHLPGDKINIRKNTTLNISARVYGDSVQVPLQRLEIISHGKVIASIKASDANQSSSYLDFKLDLKAEQGQWIAAVAYAGPQQVAHTTPIYIVVDNGSFYNPVTFDQYLTLSEQYLRELEKELQQKQENPELQSWRYKKGLEQRIKAVREVIMQLRKKY
jgi:hypothetical protein